MSDRAALVEKVARKLAADTCGKESEWPLYMRRATAAIDLIRAETLEEAARVVEQAKDLHPMDDFDTGWTAGLHEAAFAVRALKDTP